jgi:hypothetical protein
MAADSDIRFWQGAESFTYTSIASKHGLQTGSCRPCATAQVTARLQTRHLSRLLSALQSLLVPIVLELVTGPK